MQVFVKPSKTMEQATLSTFNEPAFGPDNNLPMNFGWVFRLEIPAFAKVVLTFDKESSWENAICIYDSNSVKVLERGTHHRSLSQTVFPGRVNRWELFISGWHKKGGPNARLRWNQSPFKPSGMDSLRGTIGFEDSSDGDHNDIRLHFEFVAAS